MKKLLLSLGSVAAAIAPVTAVIACSPKGDKSAEIVKSLGLTLGKQDKDNGLLLTFEADADQKIEAGTYYFTKKELEEGKEITVLSGETDNPKTTLKIKTAITAESADAKASVTTAAATPADLTQTLKVETADETKFFKTEDGVSKPLDDNSAVVGAIKDALETKTPEALFENSYTNKAILEKAINKVLESIDKKLGKLAIKELTKPKINSIDTTTLEQTPVKADSNVTTYGLKIGKQTNDGVVLTILEDKAKNIAAGTYYLPKEKLAKDQKFEVKSIDGKKLELQVETEIKAAAPAAAAPAAAAPAATTPAAAAAPAATAAATASTATAATTPAAAATTAATTPAAAKTPAATTAPSTTGVGASLKTVPATGTGITLDAQKVTAAPGDETKFFAQQGEEAATVVDETEALTQIENTLNDVIDNENVSKEDVINTINQLLIPFDEKLNKDGTSLDYTGSTITIANTLVPLEK